MKTWKWLFAALLLGLKRGLGFDPQANKLLPEARAPCPLEVRWPWGRPSVEQWCRSTPESTAGRVPAPVGPHLHNTVQLLVNTWKYCLGIGQWSAGRVPAPVGPHLDNTVQLLVNTWKYCLGIGQWSAGRAPTPVGPHLHNTVQLLVNTWKYCLGIGQWSAGQVPTP